MEDSLTYSKGDKDKKMVMENITGSLWSFLTSFVMYASITLSMIIVMVGVTYPLWWPRLFPLKFIILRNAGGGMDSNTVTLDSKIVRRGRIRNTPYGQRVKILGIPNTQSIQLIARENAIPWEGGGVAYIIYEKELNQLTAVDPKLQDINLNLTGEKKKDEKLKGLYAEIKRGFPELVDNIHLVRANKLLTPVRFLNSHVKIRPFPNELVTSQMYDMRIRSDRVQNVPAWQKWLPYAIMALMVCGVIVVAILSYEQITKTGQAYVNQVSGATDTLAQKVADKMKGEEAAPGSSIFLPLPLLGLLLRRGVIIGT